ncbi:MAG: hypothetical protein AB2989_06345 [Candidatus Symbiodolus clandestinus]
MNFLGKNISEIPNCKEHELYIYKVESYIYDLVPKTYKDIGFNQLKCNLKKNNLIVSEIEILCSQARELSLKDDRKSIFDKCLSVVSKYNELIKNNKTGEYLLNEFSGMNNFIIKLFINSTSSIFRELISDFLKLNSYDNALLLSQKEVSIYELIEKNCYFNSSETYRLFISSKEECMNNMATIKQHLSSEQKNRLSQSALQNVCHTQNIYAGNVNLQSLTQANASHSPTAPYTQNLTQANPAFAGVASNYHPTSNQGRDLDPLSDCIGDCIFSKVG